MFLLSLWTCNCRLGIEPEVYPRSWEERSFICFFYSFLNSVSNTTFLNSVSNTTFLNSVSNTTLWTCNCRLGIEPEVYPRSWEERSFICFFYSFLNSVSNTTCHSPIVRLMNPCAYQGVRNVSFSENFGYVLNGWPLTTINQAQA